MESGELNFFFVPSTTQKGIMWWEWGVGRGEGTTNSKGLPQMKFLRSVGFYFPCSWDSLSCGEECKAFFSLDLLANVRNLHISIHKICVPLGAAIQF